MDSGDQIENQRLVECQGQIPIQGPIELKRQEELK